jgi:hypothetical protein
LKVRPATEEERASFSLLSGEGYETWAVVLEAEGGILGHICLSRALGQVFGHDTRYWGKDPRGAAMLWFAARRVVRSWGAGSVLIHEEEGKEDPELMKFWERLGFKKIMTIYRGEI